MGPVISSTKGKGIIRKPKIISRDVRGFDTPDKLWNAIWEPDDEGKSAYDKLKDKVEG